MESFIFELLPERFRSEVESFDIVKLKGKFSDSVFRGSECSNVRISIKKSIYYPDGATATLCKLIGSSLYFPDLGKAGVFDIDTIDGLVGIKSVITQRLEKLFPVDAFGCCGLFRECSQAEKCLHKNPFYASACSYKANLEAGRNFYKDTGKGDHVV